MPQCFGRTRIFARCRNSVPRFFCHRHRWQPIIAIFAAISAIAMFAGLYQDLLKPLGVGQASSEDSARVVARIVIPFIIRNELSYDTRIRQSAEYYLTRSTSPSSEEVVESGTIRIPTAEGITLINERIAINPRQLLSTKLTFPESRVLAEAFSKGGFGLKIVIKNEWVEHFDVHKDAPFDDETVQKGIHVSIWKKP